MRRLIMTMAAVALMSTAALADGNYYRQHHHGGGDWAGPLIGGLVIGSMIGALSQPRAYVYEDEYYQPTWVCRTVPAYDAYGNYIGRQRRCFQRY